jgi:hypothetical protein
MTHCIYQIKGDESVPGSGPAGAVDDKLNPIKIGFGLKKRVSYQNPLSFDGGGTFTYPPRPAKP